MRFFRVQHKGIPFAKMKDFNSADGGDGCVEGLCVSGSPSGLDGGSRFGGSLDALDPDDEIVILEGYILHEIYDGYRIRPTREVARFTLKQWEKMIQDGSAYDYE